MGKKHLKLVLIGETGVGKSQLGNFILKKEVFSVGNNTNSISENISIIGDKQVTIVDTPGLDAANLSDYDIMEQIISKFQDDKAIDGIILVYSFKKQRKTKKDQELIKNLKKIFGEDILKTRLKVIITNCPTEEEFDNEKQKIEKQTNDINKRLDQMIRKEDIVFVNTFNASPHMKMFYPEIEKILDQFYQAKMRFGSMNNELIKKQELENNLRQKEELEAERKIEEKERLEKLKKELEEKNISLLMQNENERKRSFILEIFFFLFIIISAYFFINERKSIEKDHEKYYDKLEKERERLEKKFEKFYDKFENERREYKNKEDKSKEDKSKEEKRHKLKQEIASLKTQIFDSEQKIIEIEKQINDDNLAIAASSTFTVFTLGFSGFGIAHCMDSKKAHEKELKSEKDRLEYLKKQKENKENQLKQLI